MKSYDVAIIGAGISGLIAGNYLAQAGLKVFISEQHYAVGGCCSYFKRAGYTFECGAHSLGSCRKPDGYLYKIFSDLGIYDQLDIRRAECSDSLVSHKYKINFCGDSQQMASDLVKHFPDRKENIQNFFYEIQGFSGKSFLRYYSRYKNVSFDVFLSNYFADHDLKEVLSIFLGNLGVAANQISTITALALYREFLLDGGYYVTGGMKKIGDVLKKKLETNRGVVSLKDKVVKIILKENQVLGLETERTGTVSSKYVISTVSPRQTFIQLAGGGVIPSDFINKVTTLKPSVSALILYLGLKGQLIKDFNWGRSLWYIPELSTNEVYENTFNGICDENINAMLVAFPSKYDAVLAPANCETLMCILSAPYKDEDYWKSNKSKYKDAIINRLEELIPNVRQRIEVSEFATPPTLFRFTRNDNGAIYGLASTCDQIDLDFMPSKTPIKNLFLSSHWTTQGYGQAGIPVVALSAKQVAKTIINRRALQG